MLLNVFKLSRTGVGLRGARLLSGLATSRRISGTRTTGSPLVNNRLYGQFLANTYFLFVSPLICAMKLHLHFLSAAEIETTLVLLEHPQPLCECTATS